MDLAKFKPGSRFALPSGKRVEVMENKRTVVCRYLANDGRRMPLGYGSQHEVSFRPDWLAVFGTPL